MFKYPHTILLLLIFLLSCTVAGELHACPEIGSPGFVDYNCDGNFRVTLTGDSIVKGVGDSRNGNRGGYVKRLNLRFGGPGTNIRFLNLGVPGITSARLLRELKQNINNPAARITRRRTSAVDLVIVDVGRNDFFQEQPASFTVRNIRRVVKTLRREIGKQGIEPYIVVTTLIPTRRGFQQPFVDEINRQLLEFRSKGLPTYLRLDRLDTRFISSDNLHPSSRGYDQISNMISEFIQKKVKSKLLARRPDSDFDNVYDFAERTLFGTSPHLADTDGDGFDDGQELFELFSDPLDILDPGEEVPVEESPEEESLPEEETTPEL